MAEARGCLAARRIADWGSDGLWIMMLGHLVLGCLLLIPGALLFCYALTGGTAVPFRRIVRPIEFGGQVQQQLEKLA